MQIIDWIILVLALLFIVIYGSWKSKGSQNVQDYLLGNNETPWWTIGISVMATQASAITFLSTPGQAFHDGMGFVQFYFGLPIAMVIICVTFIPLYHKLKVYTAYEFLEQRFDRKTRLFAALLFLVQRGLAAGITIYAPAIILSSILGWDLNLLIVGIGFLVIIYTVSGGTKAVNVTQKQQMFVIMSGMFVAFYWILSELPAEVTFNNALKIAGISDKMKIVDFSFDPQNRYTFWSGITGGLFLALSYFGTDQSQVQRYISGKSVRESQMGLIFNGFLKIPMQFFILLTGVMVFVFFQFNEVPLNFNPTSEKAILESEHADKYRALETQLLDIQDEKKELLQDFNHQLNLENENTILENRIRMLNKEDQTIRIQAQELIQSIDQEPNDKDYVFIYYILNFLPNGLIGLLLAVILSAAMSSTASELNALSSTTTMDFYKRVSNTNKSDEHYLRMSKIFTFVWGIVAILFACFGTLVENLIQLVNIIGSVFYGTVLGIFLVAFYFKTIQAKAIFWAAVISQLIIFIIFKLDIVSFLWLNFIGAVNTIILAFLFQYTLPSNKNNENLKTASNG
uniref:sodium:solute symporter family transporter n=3 Tax=Flavobacterium sp. TaxID=239 RepID=UPI00404B017A